MPLEVGTVSTKVSKADAIKIGLGLVAMPLEVGTVSTYLKGQISHEDYYVAMPLEVGTVSTKENRPC